MKITKQNIYGNCNSDSGKCVNNSNFKSNKNNKDNSEDSKEF